MDLHNIGPYRILDRLGSGGMSSVYRALSPDGVQVAIKLLQPSLVEDPEARLRLEREASVINRVQSTGVASVLDVNTEAEIPYMVMELVHGLPLNKDVEKNGTWELSDLIDLAEWLARILEQLHDAQVLHRDIKPSNIMISRNGPVLIDFGISQLNDDMRLTKPGLIAGTNGYLSPQLHQGANPTEADDWWAWLCVLLFCSTGRNPFGTGNIAAISMNVLAGEADLSGLPQQLAAIFQAGFNPMVAMRPDAWEIIKALHKIADGEPLPTRFNEDFTKVIGVGDGTALLNTTALAGEQTTIQADSEPSLLSTLNIDDGEDEHTSVIDTEVESLIGRQASSTHSQDIFPYRGVKLRSSIATTDTVSEAGAVQENTQPDWAPSPADFKRVVAAAQAAQAANQVARKYRLQRFFLCLGLLCFGLFFFDFGIGLPLFNSLLKMSSGTQLQTFTDLTILGHAISLGQLIFIVLSVLNLLCLMLLMHINRKTK